MTDGECIEKSTLEKRSLPEGERGPAELGTETIDVGTLFISDLSLTGSFDLRSMEEAALGKLLHALPIPVLLVDHWQSIVFANKSCQKIGDADYRHIVGLPVTSLIAAPSDSEKAQALNARTISLFERAFTTRRPQKAEAIIEMNESRMWSRLHLRAIRVGSVRYVLVAVEDLTVEKVQLRLGQRNEKELMRTRTVLNDLLKDRTGKLLEADEELRAEAKQHARTAEQLRAERGRFHALCAYAPCGVARVAFDGTLLHGNARFKRIFDATFAANIDEDSGGGVTEEPMNGREALLAWLDASTKRTTHVRMASMFAVGSSDGDTSKVRVDAVKFESEYLLICTDVPPPEPPKPEPPEPNRIEARIPSINGE